MNTDHYTRNGNGRAGDGAGDGALTLLEYVCRQLLGPPAWRSADGSAYWCCPIHNDSRPSFHTLPVIPGKRDFWKCFGCGKGGDEYQLLRDTGVCTYFPKQREMVLAWEEEWSRLRGPHGSTPSSTERKKGRAEGSQRRCPRCGGPLPQGHTSSSSVDNPVDLAGRREALRAPGEERERYGEGAACGWASLSPDERYALGLARDAAARVGVSLEALARYDSWFREEMSAVEAAHYAECLDPDCGCREDMRR